jgi:hypothetical protein
MPTDRERKLASDLTRPAPAAGPRPAPAEQPSPGAYGARVNLTMSPEMKRDLELARIEDRIELTSRIMAMITLWLTDPGYRAAVDELAAQMR